MNAVNPEVDVAFGREITLAPARVLFAPSLLEAPNGRGREPAGVPAEQCDQRVLKVAGRDPLEVEDRDQHLQALRPARVWRQNRRRKADALATFAAAVTHAGEKPCKLGARRAGFRAPGAMRRRASNGKPHPGMRVVS